MSERLGAKFFAARTDLWWGEMLTERGAPADAERARVLLEKAENAAKAHGYAGLEQRATQALQDLD
jgi:hypothetical protein